MRIEHCFKIRVVCSDGELECRYTDFIPFAICPGMYVSLPGFDCELSMNSVVPYRVEAFVCGEGSGIDVSMRIEATISMQEMRNVLDEHNVEVICVYPKSAPSP